MDIAEVSASASRAHLGTSREAEDECPQCLRTRRACPRTNCEAAGGCPSTAEQGGHRGGASAFASEAHPRQVEEQNVDFPVTMEMMEVLQFASQELQEHFVEQVLGFQCLRSVRKPGRRFRLHLRSTSGNESRSAVFLR